MSTSNLFVKIEEVCSIRFGLYAQPENGGSMPYLQLRQFGEDGRQISPADEFINLKKNNEGHLLKEGEVLFVGKGNRLFSWAFKKGYGPAVASSVFFVITPDQKQVVPGYLTAVLNAPQTKTVFQQIGGGTNIFSIRKSELGAFQIPLPTLEEQKKIAQFADLQQKEIELAEQIIIQKKNLYNSIFSKLLTRQLI